MLKIRGAFKALSHVIGLLVLLITLVSSGCSKKAPQAESEAFKVQTLSELQKQHGVAAEVQSITSKPDAEIHLYENNTKYQVENKKVVARIRDPKGDETVLQYWLHRLNTTSKTLKPVDPESQGHLVTRFQLSDPKQGISVIYDQQADKVIRIYEYPVQK